MVKHMAEILIGAIERHDNAGFEYLGKAPHTFGQKLRNHIGLLEIIWR